MLHTGRFKTLGLAGLAAVLAMLVVTATGTANASAACLHVAPESTKLGKYENPRCTLPAAGGEYIQVGNKKLVSGSVYCAEVATGEEGNYEDANCSKKLAKGKYVEVYPNPTFYNKAGTLASHVAFTGTSGSGTLKAPAGTVTCTGDSIAGEIVGQNVESTVIKFTGCTSSSFECHSSGAINAGEIVTNTLIGNLVYIGAGVKPVGLETEPAAGRATEFTKEILCLGGIVKVKVYNAVICKLSPEGSLSLTGTITCEENAAKEQEPHAAYASSLREELEVKSKNSKEYAQEKSTESVEFGEEIKIE